MGFPALIPFFPGVDRRRGDRQCGKVDPVPMCRITDVLARFYPRLGFEPYPWLDRHDPSGDSRGYPTLEVFLDGLNVGI